MSKCTLRQQTLPIAISIRVYILLCVCVWVQITPSNPNIFNIILLFVGFAQKHKTHTHNCMHISLSYCQCHGCRCRIDMALNAKWAHLNCPTMASCTIMHFLGRQVNVCAFTRFCIHFCVSCICWQPKQWLDMNEQCKTGKTKGRMEKNTHTNKMTFFQHFSRTDNKTTTQTTANPFVIHCTLFIFPEIYFSLIRLFNLFQRKCSCSIVLCINGVFNIGCCWWCIPSYKWYTSFLAGGITSVLLKYCNFFALLQLPKWLCVCMCVVFMFVLNCRFCTQYIAHNHLR